MKQFKRYRKQVIEWLFEHTQKVYTRYFKSHEPWNVSRRDLLNFPKNSFGYHLGLFLTEHHFELIPKVERHDAYHTLTGFGIKVEDEIALQCLCYGNGKRSLYLYGAMILGIIILPDYYKYYYKSYRLGQQANPFHHFNYEELLPVNITDLRAAVFTDSQQKKLKISWQ
ncbi:Coq4 family protein [Psychroserpens sp. SPM9]|uniref:Coq4 family protein n=1 Tax=Psychroserpens sp. SPM9 TaxID=2975598 RepID=UPI0021A50612|nr:Coq4 family protein [Psychroserpens sp. SPM9]MDG5492669.1 Coq4 family protein [Psychroserpens sp. SPM9]